MYLKVMKILKSLNREAFKARFPDRNACYQYLAGLKWPDDYQCAKCNHHDFIKGKQPYSRKCRKCSYDESTTAGTLFHKLKTVLCKISSHCDCYSLVQRTAP